MDVLSPVNIAWNHKISLFQLPPFLRVILADVDAGSDTPSLAGKVLKWRASSPADGMYFQYSVLGCISHTVFTADGLWADIAGANNRFSAFLEDLRVLAERDTTEYRAQLMRYSQIDHSVRPTLISLSDAGSNFTLQFTLEDPNPNAPEALRLLTNIRQAAEEIRKGMRLMGNLAQVPIEPREQTALLDECISIPGVVCGGVPGGKSSRPPF
jgi:phosphomevalonate kinase